MVLPGYSGNSLTLDHFFGALDIYGLQLCVGRAGSDGGEYLFDRFFHRLRKAMQRLYLQDLAHGNIKGYKQAKKWLEREERVDAPEQASKLWRLSLSYTMGLISSYTTSGISSKNTTSNTHT